MQERNTGISPVASAHCLRMELMGSAIEGKAARVAVSECGLRASFNASC
jgi:hypothetical protein